MDSSFFLRRLALELLKALVYFFQPFHEGVDRLFDPPFLLPKPFEGFLFLSLAGKLCLYPVGAFSASEGFLRFFPLLLGFEGCYGTHVFEPDLWVHVQRMDPHEHPGRGPMDPQYPIHVVLEPGIVLAAEGLRLGEELPELLHQVPILRQEGGPDSVGQKAKLSLLFEHVGVEGEPFGLFQETVEQSPELLCVSPIGNRYGRPGEMEVVGELVDRRVDEVVLTLEIPIMDDDFPPLGVVDPVYPFTLFAGEDDLELLRVRFQL